MCSEVSNQYIEENYKNFEIIRTCSGNGPQMLEDKGIVIFLTIKDFLTSGVEDFILKMKTSIVAAFLPSATVVAER